jgi:glycosyltransferase involved in cell wall biosynthesis
LAAFGRAGLRVGLVTAFEPPDQVRAVADDVEICRYLTRSARMTGDTTEIISNGPVRTAAIALARRLKPSFIYQRHCGFLFAGVELSRRFRIPLVLEWNGSEDWIRKNWTNRFAVERMLDPLAESTERAAVTGAALVTAVSEEAVGMAERSGAARDRVIVLPNAVDLGYVDRTVRGTRPVVNTSGPVVGWAGSFGSWHGGEVMVRAMSLLPADVRLLMVGDGPDRQACQALAARLGVAERIEWTGAMPNPDTLRRLAACDVLTSPQTPLVNQPYFQSPI